MAILSTIKKAAIDYGPSVAAPIASGIINRNAAGSATDQLVAGTDKAMSEIQPYADVGKEALSSVSNFGIDELMKDPGMQFRLAEGQKALARRQASSGSLSSGAALKAAMRYNQDYASQEYGSAWDRLMDRVGIGQTSTRQMTDLMTQRADALASGDIAKANSLTGMIEGVIGGYNDVRDMGQLNEMLGIGGTRTAGPGDYTRLGGTPPFVPEGTVAAGGAGTAGGVAPGAAPGAAPTTGGGGFGSAASSFLNAVAPALPFVAAGVAALATITSNQTSDVANKLTPIQTEFDNKPNKTLQDYQGWLQTIQNFANAGGGGFQVVARQALETFTQNYGDPRAYGVTIVLPTTGEGFEKHFAPTNKGTFSIEGAI